MALDEYNKKRKFNETSEPEGMKHDSSKKLIFVIQRHSATRLHYDFRLEVDGVLKSWAIPKGPSLDPTDKRLAMMTEDHPFDYKDFEGTIPEGNYGGGEVEIWDSGTYTPLLEDKSSSKKSNDLVMQDYLNEGSIKFILRGKKLKGEFALVKIKNGKQKNAWLLIKHRDKYAVEGFDAENNVPKNSKVTEREEGRLNKKDKDKARKSTSAAKSEKETEGGKKVKNYISPMLAKIAPEPFNDKQWVFETKWDGYRAIADLSRSRLKLYSRNGLSFAEKYPLITENLQLQKSSMIIDGEIVALNKEGYPDFQALQRFSENPEVQLTYQVFDLLWLEGKSVEDLPLTERKKLLKKVLIQNDVIKYSEHTVEKGINFFKKMKKLKLEGMMAKKANSKYSEGGRTSNWLKVKFQNTEDVIICGYTKPKGSRKNFGALILGTYVNDELKYCGHAGTGFTASTLDDLMMKFKPLITKKSPFEVIPKTNTDPVWLKPELVCEIKFAEKTKDEIFRHPVFKGLRIDKEKKDVKKQSSEDKNFKSASISDKSTAKKGNSKIAEREIKVGKDSLIITHPDKLYFPESGISKMDVIDYYESVAEYILPHIKNRPQSLHRFPNGIEAPGFYQKDASDAPKWIKKIPIHAESTNKEVEYMVCRKLQDIMYLNNLGCIEMNPWNSTIKNIEKPDWLGLDLDPSAKNSFDDVIEVALAVKDILDQIKIEGYCKTSGSTGLHIYLPLNAKYEFEEAKDFAYLLMQKVNEKLPSLTTLERNLKKRGDKKIYLDYLQNSKGQTLASVYSLRPKPHAPVSMPLLWKEVKSGILPTDFNISNALERIKKNGDLFKPVLGKGIDLVKGLKKLESI
ncbi:DNA ligase D (plasmid) [Chryseobacterium sp. SNU WT5]|uniref:DNA ligase D n=1 Tax=Chryseobacterium sp. SNU WT5 TaxID=2594269 RepID=UPI00117E3179|nr:DNA ligase D [Chryseobacterium sp. SNU WT5]QDP86732.1 DNA ligase D [Chryseobacterium sp. SNU WT5]